MNVCLGCINRSSKYKAWEVIAPFCSVLVIFVLAHCVKFWAPQLKNDVENLERVQSQASEMIKCLEGNPYEKLREISMFRLQRRQLWGTC